MQPLICHVCNQPKTIPELFCHKQVVRCKKCENKRHYSHYKEYYATKQVKRRNHPTQKLCLQAYQRKWHKERRKNNPACRIANALRCRLRAALSGWCKSAKTMELLGCSWEEFVVYIERLWLPGMTWENYGNRRDQWSCDHIRPLTAFDLESPEEQRKAFHHSNIQPLWVPDNIRKSNKVLPLLNE